MPAELVIRPSWNDHQVIADLLAPGGGGVMVGTQRPLFSRIVVDAPVAAQRPQFAEAASGAGIPFLVDPITPLMQGELNEEDPWVRLTPFGRSEVVQAADFGDSDSRESLVRAVVDFQLERGATAVIPPYPYVAATDDPWLSIALSWIGETRRYLDSNRILLPMFMVVCGQLQKLGQEASWSDGLDRFAAAAAESGVEGIGVCLSPVGDGHDSYNKLMKLFRAAEEMQVRSSARVVAWRQGIYGPGLVANGLDGYETGIGSNEQSNVRGNIASRKPPVSGEPSTGRSFSGIYLEPLGRSVPRRVAQLLLANVAMRAKVMCTDEHCCPHGVMSTIDQSREHVVRTRARELATIAALPARAWRLNHIAMKAQAAHTLGTQANRILEEVKEVNRIHLKGYDALHRVTEELREADSASGAAEAGGTR